MSEQRIIIFDSPDRTGKTNIAQGLSSEFHIPYFKMPGNEKMHWREGTFQTSLEFDQTYALEFLRQTGYSVIMDRAWPSEWVYSVVFQRKTNSKLLSELDEAYAQLGAWIVVPLRMTYEIPDDLVPLEKQRDLHDMYNEFCDRFTMCNTVRIYVDTYKEKLADEVDDLASVLSTNTWPARQQVILRRR